MAVAKTKKYIVQWLLSYDDKEYQEHDIIELSDNAAQALLDVGVIKLQEDK